MNDELKGKIMTKFVVLGPDIFLLLDNGNNDEKGNGKKYVIKQSFMTKKILTKQRKHIKITTKI